MRGILIAVVLLGPLNLHLGARAQRSDELGVVAAEAHKAAVHGLVDGLGVVDGHVLLDALVVRLQPSAAVEHHLSILCDLCTSLEHGRDEGAISRFCLEGIGLVDRQRNLRRLRLRLAHLLNLRFDLLGLNGLRLGRATASLHKGSRENECMRM